MQDAGEYRNPHCSPVEHFGVDSEIPDNRSLRVAAHNKLLFQGIFSLYKLYEIWGNLGTQYLNSSVSFYNPYLNSPTAPIVSIPLYLIGIASPDFRLLYPAFFQTGEILRFAQDDGLRKLSAAARENRLLVF